MENIIWEVQTTKEPLYPSFIWDKPENKLHGSSLLIVGGSSSSFNHVSDAYIASNQLVFSNVITVLPNSLEKITKNILLNCYYGQINKSGGLAMTNLDLLINSLANVDSVLLPGNLSESSETSLLIEKFLSVDISKNIIICNDTWRLLTTNILENNPGRFILIGELAQIQKLLSQFKFPENFKSSDELVKIVQIIQKFCLKQQLKLITKIGEDIIFFQDKQVSLSKPAVKLETTNWQTELSVIIASWIKNKDNNIFQKITTAIFEYLNNGAARRT